MSPKYTTLVFPSGGLNRRLAVGSQPPFTTDAALNVISTELATGRERGGPRPAIEKEENFQFGSGAPIRLISQVRWMNSTVETTTFVVSAGGKLYKKVAGGTWAEIAHYTASVVLASDKPLATVEFRQKIYILGDNTSNRQLCVYDPSTDTLAVVAASHGTIPVKCSLLFLHNDRVGLAGDAANPQLWYLSRQGDPTDFDYTVLDDVGCAVSAATSDAGGLGEPIIAVVSHANTCTLIMGSASTVILRGDPNRGGVLAMLNNSVGIVGPRAWCWDEHGGTWWTSLVGVYRMGPGCDAVPLPVSRELLPDELLMINRAEYTVSMSRDQVDDHLKLFVTSNAGGAISSLANNGSGAIRVTVTVAHGRTVGKDYSVRIAGSHASANGDKTVTIIDSTKFDIAGSTYVATGTGTYYELTTHWWIETDLATVPTKIAFWPLSYPGVQEPLYINEMRDYIANTQYISNVWLGGRDGYIRRHNAAAVQIDDDATSVTSYVDIGPIMLGPAGMEGLLKELIATLSINSGAVTISVRVGKSAEEAFGASTFVSYTVSRAGANFRKHPRARGAFAFIRVTNFPGQPPWCLEKIDILRAPAGLLRVG